MILLEVTAQTWIITGLGFGIVLALLFCLVFILLFFGWTMQQATRPKTKAAPVPKAEKTQPATDDADAVAIAMALYLNSGKKHDQLTGAIRPQARTTAWNDKSIGLNNKGF